MKELTQAIVEQWVALTRGTFGIRDVWAELDIQSPEGRQHLRVILFRMEQAGIIAHTSKSGLYRRIDTDAKVIAWQDADPTNYIPLQFPFGLEEYIKIFPKFIIVLTGEKNSHKTPWLYNFIALNMYNPLPLDLFNSETGAEAMLDRFKPLNIPKPAPFNVYERFDNFADVIHPEHLSVIDYLEEHSEFYLVGAEIDAIFRKITTGGAVIAVQKPPDSVTYIRGVKKIVERDLAYGGAPSSWHAQLYIVIRSTRLKLKYTKAPMNPRVNPENMQWTYSLAEDGIHFENIAPYYGNQMPQLGDNE